MRALRAQLESMALDGQARYEIDVRLQAKERDFEDAAITAFGLTFHALADDGLVVAGQPVNVTLFAANHAGPEVSLTEASVTGFDGRSNCPTGAIDTGGLYNCRVDVRVPTDARLTAPYWRSLPDASRSIFDPDVPFGAPFRPSPFRAVFRLRLAGQEVSTGMPVMYRYQQDMFTGEKQMELKVVPAFSVKTTPTMAIVPSHQVSATPKGDIREIQVAVTSGLKSVAEATVALVVPAGWTVTPVTTRVTFTREDESRTGRFSVAPPAVAKAGEYRLRAVVTAPVAINTTFDCGYQVVEYPHIHRAVQQVGVQPGPVRAVPGHGRKRTCD